MPDDLLAELDELDESWDLEVTRGREVRRVEVKGSAGVRFAVNLTANEVRNAIDWTPTDLFVVEGIQLNEIDGVIRTAGGRVRRWVAWCPAPDALEPVTYSHLLHPDPELHDVVTSLEYAPRQAGTLE